MYKGFVIVALAGAFVAAGRVAGSWARGTTPRLGVAVESSCLFEREYIWGPGDSHAGVDELLALFEGAKTADLAAAATSVPNTGTAEEQAAARLAAQQAVSLAAQSRPWWVIQHASGDVVALCDSGGPVVSTGLGGPAVPAGPGAGPTTISTARVVQQFTYDAYGEVLAAEQVVDDPNVVIPNLRVGHKGLFADRLDVGITTSGTDPPSGLANLDTSGGEHLARHASVLYHASNRIYLPALGVLRYVIERTLACFSHFRRLRHCYERWGTHFLAFPDLACSRLTSLRLRF